MHRIMWRIGLALAAFLAFAVPSAEAAHPNRAKCADRDSVLCSLYRVSPAYSGQKVSRSRTHRLGAKSRIAADPATNPSPGQTTGLSGAKPIAGAAPVKLLAARNFDPLASGTDSGELTAPPRVESAASPWLKPLLIALAGGGILSLFLAKAADI